MTVIRLALASLRARAVIALLIVTSIALSVCLLLGVEKLRRDARTAFTNTISATDLIVGARSGSVQLLLYSVFRIGNATNNISWQSYLELSKRPDIAWTVPISLGDSHRGYRVLGTSSAYFEHYRFARRQQLQMASGRAFAGLFEAVLGAEVAEQLGYRVGDGITLSHGAGGVSFYAHDDKPFQVVGVLEATGTPVDRTVHVSLQSIEAIHIDWQGGAPRRGLRTTQEQLERMALEPKSITAFMLGVKSRTALFRLQRAINEYREEPLLAIVPGVALQELWDLIGIGERALRIVSFAVVVSGLLGMLTVIWSTLETRRREFAVLRSLGARPFEVLAMFIAEAGLLALGGICLGVGLLFGLIALLGPIAGSKFGIHVPLELPRTGDLQLLAGVLAVAVLAGVAPALRAYRVSLADGLTMRF